MALSPEDVRNTMFGTTRMRTGYDMDEVDSFLDVIESDLIRRTDEVQRAREAEEAMRAQNSLLHAQVRELEAHVRTLQTQLASETARADAAQGSLGSGSADRSGGESAGPADDLKHTEPLPFPLPTSTPEPAPSSIVAVAPGSSAPEPVVEPVAEPVVEPAASASPNWGTSSAARERARTRVAFFNDVFAAAASSSSGNTDGDSPANSSNRAATRISRASNNPRTHWIAASSPRHAARSPSGVATISERIDSISIRTIVRKGCCVVSRTRAQT